MRDGGSAGEAGVITPAGRGATKGDEKEGRGGARCGGGEHFY